MKKNCSERSLRVSLLTKPGQSAVSTSRWLCRCMNLPYERGHYDFESFRNTKSSAFIKSQQQTCPRCTTLPPASKQDDVPLIDPCSGLLSPAARVQLGIRQNTSFIPIMHAQSELNPRAKSETAVQTGIKGLHSSERPNPVPIRTLRSVKSADMKKDAPTSVPNKWMDLALRYTYTSAAQRGYEDVDWDSRLPPCLKPPVTALEKMTDPLNQSFILKRYHSKPELWQVIGLQWDKRQLLSSDTVRKPSSFHPTIPGYTGKAHHDRPHTSAISLTSAVFTPPVTESSPKPSLYGRRAPFSRMVTTVPPSNPYLLPKAFTCPIQRLLQLQCTKSQ
ncbi:protein SPMIP7 [Trichomycterus rosablanca]|uniref:protein SPMIP7 n=1 Tax=Trichomycterus rosablanca TaxID=2290929 RepID=UPI002F35A5C6